MTPLKNEMILGSTKHQQIDTFCIVIKEAAK